MTDSSPCPRCDARVDAGARFCSVCGAPAALLDADGEDQLLARLRQATLGEYDVLRQLGRGGMAAVYLAWDRELARFAAIKVLLPELAHQATMARRFLQEARTAANLDDHASVVRVYRAKESQGLRYFVMKYVDGCSLDVLLRAAGPLPVDLAAHVIDQVALALQYAHDRGVVHRDVKPGNVLLDRAGSVIVTDFGIAKVAQADHLTHTGFAIGTPHYMSPEQWRAEPLTPSADQYGLGVVAYYAVSGDLPFDGTHYELQEHHLRSEPPALDAARAGVPAEFATIVRHMLGKHPAQRFADLRTVSQALAAIARDPAPVLRERLSRLIVATVPEAAYDAGAAGRTPADASPPAGFLRPAPYTPGNSLPPELPVAPYTPAGQGRPKVGTPPVGMPGVPAVGGAVPEPRAGSVAAALTPPDGLAPEQAVAAVRPVAAAPTVYAPPARASAPAVAPAVVPPADPPVADASRVDGPSGDEPLASSRPADAARARPRRVLGVTLAAGVVVAALALATTRRGPAPTGAAIEGAGAVPPAVSAAPGESPVPAAPPDTAGTAGAGVPAPDLRTPAIDTTTPIVVLPHDTTARIPAAVIFADYQPNARFTLAQGDSARLVSTVVNRRRQRLTRADVRYTSTDPARVVRRGKWLVALAVGGPVTVTATSGAARSAVHVDVVPPRGSVRDSVAPRATLAAPADAEVRAAVDELLAALRARDAGVLARLLTERAGDGSPTSDFLDWLRDARGFAVERPATGRVGGDGAVRSVAVRAQLRYSHRTVIRSYGSVDAVFNIGLRHTPDGWRIATVQLARRAVP